MASQPQLCVGHPSLLEFIELNPAHASTIHELGIEAIGSLTGPQAWLSPKFFYDTLGSVLFTAICHLPEYYPTRTEAAIFADNRAAIAAAIGQGRCLIDLGAGDCAKAVGWFESLQPAHYIPVDISTEFLKSTLQRLKAAYPTLPMSGIGADFTRQFVLPTHIRPNDPLFFYPGSSIGNFDPSDALRLLKEIAGNCGTQGQILIGVDLIKSNSVLVPAYDDSLGVTASFNKNALAHVNQLIGANFQLQDWRHVALFDDKTSRIEMHLEALRDQVIQWQGGARVFHKGERIHTENSYKYRQADFSALLAEAGFSRVQSWTDTNQWFGVFLGSRA
jgi:dimethylhistidine N-methyltransferase